MGERKIHWRCFHCGETFTKPQERWAREHFGRDCSAEPVCLIRSAGENALLSALRAAEDELAGYRAEDSLIIRSMHSMSADHVRALIREEEKGFARGLEDAKRYPESIGLSRPSTKLDPDPKPQGDAT